eukprot:TRINITY_DN3351_c0_g2_i11.p3 TRINITY_DN3351_c0_g2~~TRINITY_DN3351_c0_g2_i11.p3  ORF type:complete len:264 (-),score=15.40 TRINITY_DN3351_c0_g2_i11:709-1455(-)
MCIRDSSKRQLLAGIIMKCQDDSRLNFGYKNAEMSKNLLEVGGILVKLSQTVPNGILVFFPSIKLMEDAFKIWRENSIIDEIEKRKSVKKEPRNKRLYEKVLKDYKKESQDKGSILLAVCRGRSSEGLNFSDEGARAVIVVGMPNLNIADEKVRLKKERKDSNREWYQEQMMRAVNQAIGRVIRHKEDYGMLLFCDDRYYACREGFSKWVQPSLTLRKLEGKISKKKRKMNRLLSFSKPNPRGVYRTQ